MSHFYKMNPSAWDFGTTNLSLEEEAALLRIVNAIHKHDQAVPDNDRHLAGMFRCSIRKARSLIRALVKAGKIRIESGNIVNDRAYSDLVQRGLMSISKAESGANGGRKRAENAAKALKKINTTQADASSRIEENREEEKEEAKASSKKNGDRLPADWVLPKAWGDWAVKEGLSEADARQEADKFRDYWTAKAGKDASKLDWQATWRNWVRMAIADRQHRQDRKSGQAGKLQPREGDLRTLSRNKVQRYCDGQWQLCGDLTAKEAEDHDRFIGRARAYA